LGTACNRQTDEPRRKPPSIILADPAQSAPRLDAPPRVPRRDPIPDEAVQTEDDYLRQLMAETDDAGGSGGREGERRSTR
jgi:hypothetical protein